MMGIPQELLETFAQCYAIVFIGPELGADVEASVLVVEEEETESEQEASPTGQPSEMYRVLSQLPTRHFLTTSHDDRFEEALQAAGLEFQVVEQKVADDFWRSQQVHVVKLVESPLSLALERLLHTALHVRPALFVGFRADDPQLRRWGAQVDAPRNGQTSRWVILLTEEEQEASDDLVGYGFSRQFLANSEEMMHWVGQLAEQARSKKQQLAESPQRSPSLPPTPYKFLDYFSRKDTSIFHGRTFESEMLLHQVLTYRLSILHGRAGAGKSSLLQAALAPRLKGLGYRVVVLRLSDVISTPVEALKEALFQLLGKSKALDSSASLATVIKERLPSETPLLIVIDQLEAWLRGYDAQLAALMQEMNEALGVMTHEVRLLLVVRSEDLGDLDAFGTDEYPDFLHQRMRLGYLTIEGAQTAIVEPATAFGLTIEPALLERLLMDLSQHSSPAAVAQRYGGLPERIAPALLQIVCTMLWQTWKREGGFGTELTLAAYEQLGGSGEILASYLDQAVGELKQPSVREAAGIGLENEESQLAARELLKGMLEAEEGNLVVRSRRVTFRELSTMLQLESTTVQAFLKYMTSQRLVRRLPDGKHYRLIHELMLPDVWEWFDVQERHTLALQDLLQRATQEYLHFGRLLPRRHLNALGAHVARAWSSEGAKVPRKPSDSRLEGAFTPQALRLLLVSAITHHLDPQLWVTRMTTHQGGGTEDTLMVLASLLADGKRAYYPLIAKALGETDDPRAIDHLYPLLQESDNHIQRAAIDALVALNQPSVAQTLYHAARQEEALPRIVPLIEALETLRTTQAAQMLSLLASDHANPHARSRAANGLLYLGHSQGIHLIAHLASSDDPNLQNDAEQAAKRAWDENREEFVALLQHYDPQLRLDAVRVLKMVGHADTNSLLLLALQDNSVWVRREAIAGLRALGLKQEIKSLMSMLHDEDAEVRRGTVYLLSMSADSEAIPFLVDMLSDERFDVRLAVIDALGKLYPLPLLCRLGHADAGLRQETASALGTMGNRRALAPLIATLRDEVAVVRVAALSAVARLGTLERDQAILPALLTTLGDESTQVRITAARVLGELVNPQAVSALIHALSDRDYQVRIAAARALVEGVDQLPEEEERIVAALIDQLEDEVPEVRMVVASLLEQLQDEEAVQPLIAALSDAAPQVRMAAAEALGHTDEPDAIGPLLACLEDDDFLVRLSVITALGRLYPVSMLQQLGQADPQVRQDAATALGEAKEMRAVMPLLATLQDESPMVVVAAISALGHLGDKQAVPILLARLPNASPPERLAIASACARLKDRRAIEPMLTLLDDNHPKIRRRAVTVLGLLGARQVLEALYEALKDNDYQVRMAAANAMGRMPDPRSVMPLLAVLSDPLPQVRATAANALAHVGDAQAVNPLLIALQDEDFNVRLAATRSLGVLWSIALLKPLGDPHEATERQQAATTLGEQGEKRAVEPLMAALQDRSANVRLAAAHSLGQLREPRAIPALQAIREDKYAPVRTEVARALRQLLPLQTEEYPAMRLSTSPHGTSATQTKEQTLPGLNRLQSRHVRTRRAGARMLGRSRDPRAVDALITALSDPAPEVRLVVIRALEQIENQKAVEPLIASLQDDVFEVRLAAMSALGVFWESLFFVQLGSENVQERYQAVMDFREEDPQSLIGQRALTSLLATLHDPVQEIRLATLMVLGTYEQPEAISALLTMLSNGSPAMRAGAAEALALSQNRQATAPLLQALKDNEMTVRLAAMRGLGQLYAFPGLVRLGDLHTEIRLEALRGWESAVQTAHQTGSPLAIDPLLATLRDDESAIRGEAANALKALGEVAVTPLIECLTQRGQTLRRVRRHAARLLGQLRDQRAIPVLTAALQDEDDEVRQQAAISLRLLGEAQSLTIPLEDLQHPDAIIRQRAASVLGQLRNREAVNPLIAALEDEDEQVRREAATSLGQLRSKRALMPLLKLLESEIPAVRWAAIRALGLIYPLPLLAQLGSENPKAREDAAQALGDIDNSQAFEPLIASLKDPVPDVRVATAYALKQRQELDAIDPLVETLYDEVPEVQEAVASALRQIERTHDIQVATRVTAERPDAAQSDAFLAELSTIRALGALWNRPLLAQLGSENPETRQQAAYALGESGDAQAVKPLLTALSWPEEQPEVRQAVITALGRLGDKRAVAPIMAFLTDDKSAIRLASTQALARFKAEESLVPLAARLEDDNPNIRLATVEGLANFTHAEPYLLDALQDSDLTIRRAAMRSLATLYEQPLLADLGSEQVENREWGALALGEFEETRAVPALFAALQIEDEVPQVREVIINTLAYLQAPPISRSIEAITSVLESEPISLRWTAIRALGQLYEWPMLGYLGNQDAETRWEAATLLADSYDLRAIPSLLATLHDPVQDVRRATLVALGSLWELIDIVMLGNQKAESRREAALNLGQLAEPRAITPLLSTLQDDEAQVRRAVVTALGQLKDTQAILPLLTSLQDKNRKVRGQTAKTLTDLGKLDSTSLRHALTTHPAADVRRHLARILGQLRDEQAIMPLIGALQDENADVRQNAAVSLRQLGANEQAVPPTLRALQNDEPTIRARAASVLGQLRDARAVKPLIAVLKEDDPIIRQEATRSLGQLRHRRTLNPLIAILTDDPETEVRRRAAIALKLLGDPRAIAPLEAALKDPDPKVQQAVTDALHVLRA